MTVPYEPMNPQELIDLSRKAGRELTEAEAYEYLKSRVDFDLDIIPEAVLNLYCVACQQKRFGNYCWLCGAELVGQQ